jgi:hypothetical protein
MEDFFKFVCGFIMVMALIISALLAAPTMWEKATTDKPEYPHSGFSPECPTWEAPVE